MRIEWKKPSLTNLEVEFTKTETSNETARGELYCACCGEHFGNQYNDPNAENRLREHRLDVHGTLPGQPCPIS